MSGISINRDVTSIFSTHSYTLIHTHLYRITEDEKDTRESKKEVTTVGRSSYYFWVSILVFILSLRK